MLTIGYNINIIKLILIKLLNFKGKDVEMKVSTKGKYAVLAAYELAVSYNKQALTIKAIADNQQIPKQYLDQLMKKLRQQGVVESIRGPKGGYRLSRPPGEITVGEVIRAVEEPTVPVECKNGEKCGKCESCVASILWDKIANSISRVIDRETLEDMLNY